MEFTVHGDGGERLLFVMGWGNTPAQTNVAWLLDRLVDAGYAVHAAELPTNVRSFTMEYLGPVRRRVEEHGFDRVLSHSAGGLIAPFLDADVPQVFLSPWWGLRSGAQAALLPLYARLPTDRPLLPSGIDFADVGDLAESPEREGPGALSPTFAREIGRAQRQLPSFDADDVVFCTLTDELVSVPAIGERAPARNVRLYDGKHEFFSSAAREDVLPDVLGALEHGPDALP